MLDPLTFLEVHDLVRDAALHERGITIADIRTFVLNHVWADAVYVARGEQGQLHGAAFGWPVRDATDYAGEYRDEPDGTIFFCNLLVTDTRDSTTPTPEIMATLKRHVSERWPAVTHFCYQRAKHEDRMKLYELERLDRER